MDKRTLQEQAAVYREKIITEISFALGFSRTGLARQIIRPLFWIPASRFGKIAAKADDEVPRTGITGGARLILPDFSMNATVHGAENIPASGPMLLVSNHPGGYDSVVIMSCIPRADLKIFVSDVPFTHAFPIASHYFFFVGENPIERMAALRDGIEHLKSGGAVMIFAHGEVEPDPELSPGAHESIRDWSRSVEIMLRKVPEAWLLVTVASGVLMKNFFNSPIAKTQKESFQRQKLAEFMQISQQLVLPRTVQTDVHISFAKAMRASDIPQGQIMPTLIATGQQLLEEHMQRMRRSPS